MTHFSRPVVALLTDFGMNDGYVGVLKGVILTTVPNVQLVDITHTISPQQVADGAWVLATSYRYFPQHTIFLCVVDPGVGSSRRPIALHAGNWFFIGPDNGLFSFILAEQAVHEAIVLDNATYHLPQTSTTFHGRDIFAPVAAHIATGVALAALGSSIDPAQLYRLQIEQAVRQDTHIEGQIIHVDTYGNLITNIPITLVPDLFTHSHVELSFPVQKISVTERRRFFADTSNNTDTNPFLYSDSAGYIGVAIQNGNASRTLGIENGVPVLLFFTAKR